MQTIEELMAKYYPTKSIKKTGTFSPGTAGSGTFWEPLFGAKTWSWLNEEKNIFSMLPKEPWGKSGWRVTTTRATATAGIDADADSTIPTAYSPTLLQVSALPKLIAASWKLGEMATFVSSVDDAVELIALHREQRGLDHANDINTMLGVLVETGAAGDNLESIDRVCGSMSEFAGNSGIGTGEGTIYGTNKTAATTFDAQVNHASATDRDLTLTLIDTVLQLVYDAGGVPKVIMTGTESWMRWQQLLEAERRFVDTARIVPTFGGVKGLAPGVEAGFMVATYNGIPIITSQHILDHDTIESIYYLDTDYLKFATAKPTTYSETGAGKDFLNTGYFAYQGLYETMGELRCYRFNTQGKLCDLK